MKTIRRNDSRFKPSNNFNDSRTKYLSDSNIKNLIKRADEYCVRYNLEYKEQIYKVIETPSHHIMNNSGVRLKSNKTRYKGSEVVEKVYYEVQLTKVVA